MAHTEKSEKHHDSHDDHHAPSEGVTRTMVLFSLGLFFVMTVTGHFVFVASAHHTESAAPAHHAEGHETPSAAHEAEPDAEAVEHIAP